MWYCRLLIAYPVWLYTVLSYDHYVSKTGNMQVSASISASIRRLVQLSEKPYVQELRKYARGTHL